MSDSAVVWPLPPSRTSVLAFFDPPRAVILLIIVGTIVRIAMAAATGLGSDESYTVANARVLALSYVDYPPLHVWIVGIWSWLWSSESPLIVRLPFIALFAGSTWLMFRLSAFLFGLRAGLWAALLFNLAPVFTLPHASWVLPDGPLIFFLLSCAFVVARLLFEDAEPSAAPGRWMLAGVLGGLAMLSKYHGAFLLAGTFVFLLAWRPGRRLLATPGPWFGALVALALFAPVIVWNSSHDWAGLFFQAQRLSTPHLEFGRVLTSIGAQAGYLAPWLFVPLCYVWIISLRSQNASPQRFFLAVVASGPIFFFTLANIISPGLPHWTMPGWLFLFPVLGAEAARIAKRRPKLMFGATAATATLLMAVIATFGTEAKTGWMTDQIPQRYVHSDPTIDLWNWADLEAVLRQRHLLDQKDTAIAATHWNEAGKLNYIMGKRVSVLCLCADPQQFRYLQTPARFAGKNVIIIGAHRDVHEIGETLRGLFDRMESLEPIILRRAGRIAVELTVMRGIGFRPGARG